MHMHMHMHMHTTSSYAYSSSMHIYYINIRRNKYIILCTSSYITIKSRTRVHKILASMDSMHYLVRRNS